MIITIKPAALKDKPIIAALLQPYLEELYRFPDEHPDQKDNNDIYQYPYLDAYWQEEERFPYLFYSGNDVAGFALVRKVGDHWEMAEIYVKPLFRRQGLAQKCVEDIFLKHPGKWEIGFNRHNTASRNLWKKLGDQLSNGTISEGRFDNDHDYVRFTIKTSQLKK
jgi:predicted acetyltransferase